MNTYYVILFSLFFFYACSPSTEQVNSAVQEQQIPLTQDSIVDAITKEQPTQWVKPIFVDLARFIDSAGFIGDSARRAKTYNFKAPLQKTDKYNFYTIDFEQHPVNYHITEILSEKRDTEWGKQWHVDSLLFNIVENITLYFYVNKKLFTNSSTGWNEDGLIEAWTFENSTQAKNAAMQLAQKQTMVFVNRGAYICYLDNQMYVFHSRAAGFYTPLKRFFKHFTTQNNATIPKQRMYR